MMRRQGLRLIGKRTKSGKATPKQRGAEREEEMSDSGDGGEEEVLLQAGHLETLINDTVSTTTDRAFQMMETRFGEILERNLKLSNDEWLKRSEVLEEKVSKQIKDLNNQVQLRLDELNTRIAKVEPASVAPSLVSSALGHSQTAGSLNGMWAAQRIEVKGFLPNYDNLKTEGAEPKDIKTWVQFLKSKLDTGLVPLIAWENTLKMADMKERHPKFFLHLVAPDNINASVIKARVTALLAEQDVHGDADARIRGHLPKLVVEASPQEKPLRIAAGRAFSLLERHYRLDRDKFSPVWGSGSFKIKAKPSDAIVLSYELSTGWNVNIEPFRVLAHTVENADQVRNRLES